ncbi:hypothetical protein KFE25_000787 [Diacronema lutheri]|uniref:Centrosomal protein 43 n=1 Tax=Diacronema lutheri TaxID=2081491 RepID=A0A8J5XES4_DIALT|nr:hypothetical protein KFE25_000787 [Diacronema lutheri]
MSSAADELHEVLRETLEAKGTMSRLRASIRAEVFGALQDEDGHVPRPTNENLLINDMIREYLAFNRYDHTLAVFMPESGQPASAIDRRYLSEQTGLPLQDAIGGADGRSLVHVPILYGLLAESHARPVGNVAARVWDGAPGQVSLAGAAAPLRADDAEISSRYRVLAEQSQQGDAQSQPHGALPGSSMARARKEPRACGGGAPDPLVFSH